MPSVCEICGVEHPPHEEYEEGEMRVLITTYPKTGTNLIIQMFGNPVHIQISHNALYAGAGVNSTAKTAGNNLKFQDMAKQIRDFPGVAFGHIPYNNVFFEAMMAHPTTLIQLVRDPRDVIVSHYYHIREKPEAAFNHVFQDGIKLADKPDPMMELIKLSPSRWERFTPWMEHSLLVKYEDLRTNPHREAARMIDKVGEADMSQWGLINPTKMVNRIRPQNSPTFRKGGTGDWRIEFNREHVAKYEELMKDIHEELGYEL